MKEKAISPEEYGATRNEFFERHGRTTSVDAGKCETTYYNTYKFADGAAWVEELEFKQGKDTDLVAYAVETGIKAYRTPFFRNDGRETNRMYCEIAASVGTTDTVAQNATMNAAET